MLVKQSMFHFHYHPNVNINNLNYFLMNDCGISCIYLNDEESKNDNGGIPIRFP